MNRVASIFHLLHEKQLKMDFFPICYMKKSVQGGIVQKTNKREKENLNDQILGCPEQFTPLRKLNTLHNHSAL